MSQLEFDIVIFWMEAALLSALAAGVVVHLGHFGVPGLGMDR